MNDFRDAVTIAAVSGLCGSAGAVITWCIIVLAAG